MEEIRGFQRGLNQDINPLNQPENTYRDALNFVQVSEEGNVYALTNEAGTIDKQVNFPAGFVYMGHTVLDTDIIVFLVHPDGYSQIGVIDADFLYTRAVPEPTDVNGDTNDELGFEIGDQADVIARKLFTGDRTVYWAIEGKNMGYVSLDNPPPTGDITDNVRLIPNQLIPEIELDSIEEVAGNLRVGAYHFVTRYWTQSLTATSFGIPSNIIPIVDETRDGGRDQFDGEYPDFGTVNKAINLRIENIDQSYPFLQVIVIRYSNITNTFTAEAQPLINITGDTINYKYSGEETDVVDLTAEEIRELPISYSSAKAVTQKDNVAFFSNLRDSSAAFDDELQQFFNDVQVKYKIREVQYLGSVQEDLSFFLANQPYVTDPDTTPIQEVRLEFSKDVDVVDGTDVNNFTLSDGGEFAVGKVRITSPADLYETAADTIEVAGVVFTAVNGAVTPGAATFDASGTVADVSNSLVAQVNAHATTGPLIAAGYDSTADEVIFVAKTAGTAGNSYTLVYTDNGAVVGATVLNVFAGGVDPITYTPDTAVIDGGSNIVLTFSLPGDGIPSGSTIDIDTINDSTGNESYASGGFINVSFSSIGLGSTQFNTAGAFTDYKNEALTFYFKGYRRDEVYSLGGVVNFKDGGHSFAYHIPGNDKTATVTSNATPDASTPSNDYTDDNREGLLGTYVSTIDYPLNQNYPGNQTGDDQTLGAVNRKIKHHKMPSLQQEPHFKVDGNGNTFIRIIGLEFTFNKQMTPELLERIQSITLVRERRNESQNRSILAQGMVDRYVRIARSFNFDGNADDYAYKKMPFFNNTAVNNVTVNTGGGNLININGSTNEPSIAFTYDNIQSRDLAFFSPDTQLGAFNPNDALGATLRPELRLTGTVQTVEFKRSQNQAQDYVGGEEVYLRRFYLAWLKGDYTDLSTDTQGSDAPTIVRSQYVPKGAQVNVENLNEPIENQDSSRHLYIQTNTLQNAVSFGLDASTITLKFQANMSTSNSIFNQTDTNDNSDGLTYSGLSNNLMNLVIANTEQYGDIGGSTFIPIKTFRNLPSTPGLVVDEVFGGDTFISKMAIRNCDVYFYKGIRRSSGGFGILGANFDRGYSNSSASQHSIEGSAFQEGMDLRSFMYFFVESEVNANYRHVYVDRSDPLNPVSEPTYFPRSSALETLRVQVQSGDSNGYNLQYSFENNAKTFNTKLSQSVEVGVFETRTIYSNQATEDEVTDSFRIFPQNNFYDLPKHTGPIWDNFVHANRLFLHTPKSLWRTYVNDVTHQASDIGQVVLGTGGLFTIPAKEIVTAQGGYAGSISQFGGIETPFGYAFPDALQGKYFILIGEELREISAQGLQQRLNDDLGSGLVSGSDYVDTPFNPNSPVGIVGGYDFEKKRLIFCKRGAGEDFAYSYSFLSKSWVSRHSYLPPAFVAMNNKLYSINNTGTVTIHEHNNGDFGSFYGVVYPSTLELVFNKDAAIEKVFDNFIVHSKSSLNEVVQLLDTWDSMRVRTDIKNTGDYSIIPTGDFAPVIPAGSVKARRLKNKYQITIPGNAVVDDTQNIENPANLDNTQLFKARVKGDHAIAYFQYNNSDNFKFIVNFISCLYRHNRN